MERFVPLHVLERSVQLVDALADLRDSDEFISVLLGGLADLIGCDVLSYNEIGTAPATVVYADWPPGALDQGSRDTFRRFVHQHPLINYYRKSGDGRAVMINDFVTTVEFHRLDLYAHFFQQVPVEHQLAITLNDPCRTVIGVALNRTDREFSETDRAVLTALRGPLVSALMRMRLRQKHSHAPASALLSPREITILDLVGQGRTNAAIAHELSISRRTVAKHLERIYRKLHVSSRAAAVRTMSGAARD
ncbi:MAG TPA: LuxR C-terminal-related transcriptional regulator [Mycobacteriales bacterium]|nr:LuxR C-terminal-related transcriptional regulator [Mycobacteriales bacterium]